MFDGIIPDTFLGITSLQLLEAVGVVAGLFLIQWVLQAVLFQRLHAIALRSQADWDNILVKAARTPFQIMTLCFAILIIVDILPLSASFIRWMSTAAHLGFILAGFAFLSGAAELVSLTIVRWMNMRNTPMDEQLCPLITRVLRFFIWLLGALTLVQNMGYSITGFIASLGIGGAAIAFASQDTIANVFGSMKVLADRPFVIGDWIKSTDGKIEGVIEDVGFLSTRIRTFADTQITVPNNCIANMAIENFSRMTKRRIFTQFGLAYGLTTDQLKAIANAIEAYLRSRDDLHQDIVYVRYSDFNDEAMHLMLYFFTQTTAWETWMEIRESIYLKCLDIITENGGHIAIPARDLYVQQLPEQIPVSLLQSTAEQQGP